MLKLEAMLKYVSEHNEFYMNRIKEYGITNPLDITQWPILTRKELQENRYKMFSDGYKSKYFNQQLRRQSSSGSSGMPVNVYWDYKDWYASNMSLWRKRLQWYGIHPSDRYVMFTLNAMNTKETSEICYIKDPANILSVNVSLLHDEISYKKLVDIINEFNPVWLYIQPFLLNKLLLAYKSFGLSKPSALKYIESIGEVLSSDIRRRAVDFFNVPLANMYGSEEMNGIAYECPYHHMHVLDDNILIELGNQDKVISFNSGESIITNLNNFAMPLIRYNQNDRIELNDSQCLCGCRSKTIDIIIGRSRDLILYNEKEINLYMLNEIIAEINNQFNDAIIAYRYIYSRSDKTLVCNIKLDKNNEGWFENIKEGIINIFCLKFMIEDRHFLKIDKLNEMPYNKLKNNILSIVD